MIITVLDVATTGLDPSEHAVIEMAMVHLRNDGQQLGGPLFQSPSLDWQIENPRRSFVDPGRLIPPEASAIHHIIQSDVAGAPNLNVALGVLFPG